MNAHSLTGFECRKAIELHVTIPPELALQEAKRLNLRTLPPAKEATFAGCAEQCRSVWVPTQLEIGLV